MSWRSTKDGKHFKIRPRSSGTHVRMSQKGSSMEGMKRYPSSGIVHKGSLTKYGYHLDESEDSRHRALDQAEAKYGYAKTVEKLDPLEGVNKGHPNHAKVKSDIEYLENKHFRPGQAPLRGKAFEKFAAQQRYKHEADNNLYVMTVPRGAPYYPNGELKIFKTEKEANNYVDEHVPSEVHDRVKIERYSDYQARADNASRERF